MSRASSWARRPTTARDGTTARPASGHRPLSAARLQRGDAAEAVQQDAGTNCRSDFRRTWSTAVPLDTTKAVTAGIHEIVITLWKALGLVILVVYIFLQGWRATLIPLLAVPVSLIGTFVVFPLSASPSTRSRCSAWCWPSAWWSTTPSSWSRRWSTTSKRACRPRKPIEGDGAGFGPGHRHRADSGGGVYPHCFIPGITGRLYQQFAVTIAISVLLSAFNALTLSPALCALLLKPKKRAAGPWRASSAGSTASSAAATRRLCPAPPAC